jgi:hypothetical protein
MRVFTNPDGFFREIADDMGLTRPLVIITVMGILTMASTVVIMLRVSSAMSSEVGAFTALGGVVGAIGGFVGVYIMWVIYSAVFHVLSTVFGGEGSFRRTMILTAWGFAPGIIASLVSLGITVFALQGISLPSDPAQVQPFVQDLKRRPIFFVGGVLSIVFTIWQGFIWLFAVKHARNLTLPHAAITVGVPVAMSVAWNAFTLV